MPLSRGVPSVLAFVRACHVKGAPAASLGFDRKSSRFRSRASETLAIAKGQSDPITKRVQEVVLSLTVLIAHSKAFDLIHQVILRSPLGR
jgi:hypothetical protein